MPKQKNSSKPSPKHRRSQSASASIPKKKKGRRSPTRVGTKSIEQPRPQVVPEFCPVCEAELDYRNQVLIAQVDDHQCIHGACRNCLSHLLLFEFGRRGTVFSAAMIITDCSAADCKRAMAQKTLTEDDMFAIHDMLSHASAATTFIEHSLLT